MLCTTVLSSLRTLRHNNWHPYKYLHASAPNKDSAVVHQICQYKCLVFSWAYPGFSSKQQMESDSKKKGKRKVQGVPQSQTTALPRHLEEEETDKTKQALIEQTYEKHQD